LADAAGRHSALLPGEVKKRWTHLKMRLIFPICLGEFRHRMRELAHDQRRARSPQRNVQSTTHQPATEFLHEAASKWESKPLMLQGEIS
jgi:hypothetical protein